MWCGVAAWCSVALRPLCSAGFYTSCPCPASPPHTFHTLALAACSAALPSAATLQVVHHLLKSELGGIYEFMTEGFKKAWSISVR